MGFTIEDMLVLSEEPFKMKLIAGKNGWSNSIKWIFMFEEMTLLEHFSGKEMGVTTGLGFQSEEKLLQVVTKMAQKHASAMLINTGYYIKEIPQSVIDKCDEEDLPLLVVPWEIEISNMIKILSLHIFQADQADEQISKALIRAIEQPEARDLYENDLLPYFDNDGKFQTVLISTGELDTMDTVERNRLSYLLQNFLVNITHNGNFFYYDSYFVLVMNNVLDWVTEQILDGFFQNSARKLPDVPIYIGVGSPVDNIQQLYISFRRAKSAMAMAIASKKPSIVFFDRSGINRLFYSIPDQKLVREMGEDLLKPLIEYDGKHGTDYVKTLFMFLQYNGSIQAVAKEMFTHRNTVIYHINNIKKLLNTDLSEPKDRLPYLIACLIYLR